MCNDDFWGRISASKRSWSEHGFRWGCGVASGSSVGERDREGESGSESLYPPARRRRPGLPSGLRSIRSGSSSSSCCCCPRFFSLSRSLSLPLRLPIPISISLPLPLPLPDNKHDFTTTATTTSILDSCYHFQVTRRLSHMLPHDGQRDGECQKTRAVPCATCDNVEFRQVCVREVGGGGEGIYKRTDGDGGTE